MTKKSYDRSLLAKAALQFLPPMIRKALVEEPRFLKEYELSADEVLGFGDSGVSILRSELFSAIRKIYSGAPEKEVTDTEGQSWNLKKEKGESELRFLVLYRGEQQFRLPDFSALSSNETTRLRNFDRTDFCSLPSTVRETWRNILIKRALDDDEFFQFDRELCDTPVHVAESIRLEIHNGQKIKLSSLVPPSRRYFNRLVGTYDGSISIKDYAAGVGKSFFDQLKAWDSYDGFLFGLLLSSHSTLTAKIDVENLETKDLVRAYSLLEKQGDRISQLGAIEVGLRVITERPEIEPFIARIAEQIRDDDVEEKSSGFKLLFATFILVDGELSRIRLFPSEPPFYRRLVSLSQASLIARQIVNSRVEIDSFCEFALNKSGERFLMQTLADMRLEPRWNPNFVDASQMKEDFFDRIMIVAKNFEKQIKDSNLYDLILGTDAKSFNSLTNFPRSHFPGPLEGAADSPNILPAELSEMIESRLRAKDVKASSFIALVNSANICRVEYDHAELAAKALQSGNYRLAKVEDRSQFIGILNGLATVAATARSSVLADKLRILVRRYRQDAQYALSIEEAMIICLVAAASRTDLNDWRKFAGDWITELAFGELKDNEGEVFHSHLRLLLQAVPELWVTCGRADAALRAHNGTP